MSGESIQSFPPGGSGGSITPAFEDWNFVTVTGSKTVAAGDWSLVTGSGVTLTLPTGLAPGNRVAATRFGANSFHVVAGSGENINSSTASLIVDAAYNTYPSVVLIKVSSTAWEIESMAGTDLEIGSLFSGVLQYSSSLVGHSNSHSTNYTIQEGDDTLIATAPLTFQFGTDCFTGQYVTIINNSGPPTSTDTGVVLVTVAAGGSITGPTALGPGDVVRYMVVNAGSEPTVNVISVDLGTSGLSRSTITQAYVGAGGQAISYAAPAGDLFAMPFFNGPAAFTVGEMLVNITSAGSASSVIALAIYEDNGSYAPGALLASAGTINVGAATGIQSITGLSIELAPNTLYWIACVTQGAPATVPTLSGLIPLGCQYSSAFGQANVKFISGVTGALPNPFGTPSNNNEGPLVLLHT